MRFPAKFLRALAIGPLVALGAAVAGPPQPASANSGDSAPQPVVIAIDPGHGGAYDPNNPTQPFDSGAIGVNGLLEKDVTLDVAKRLATLLREDLVEAVLTRTTDQFLSLEQREQVAIEANAALFVSIHCNSFPQDQQVGGSLVLYPNTSSQAFAQALSNALGSDLAASGVGDDGIQLRANLWIHAPMPTSTVEMAYLSNAHEAALMNTEAFRQAVAAAIRDGIERYDPTIATRKQEILVWQKQHGVPLPTPRPITVTTQPRTSTQSAWGTVILWLVLVAVAAVLLRWRRPVLRGTEAIAFAAVDLLQGGSMRHAANRRRRRRLRARARARTEQWKPRSVYDELSF